MIVFFFFFSLAIACQQEGNKTVVSADRTSCCPAVHFGALDRQFRCISERTCDGFPFGCAVQQVHGRPLGADLARIAVAVALRGQN